MRREDGVELAVHLELEQHRLDVVADGVRAQPELAGDAPCVVAARQVPDDLDLTSGEGRPHDGLGGCPRETLRLPGDRVEELTDAKWKGKVGLPPGNASFQSFVTGFREAEGDDAAEKWLTGMKDNDTQIFEKNGDVLEAVDKGTIDIGLINHYYLAGYAEEVGEDKVKAKLKFPDAGDPGALVNVTGAAALSDHPGAEELITFLVSEEAQEHFAEETNEYPLVESVDAPEDLPPLEDIDGPIEDLSDLADVETSITMIDEAGLS